jgi:hypothetical protein
LISGVESTPLVYDWILNASLPSLTPGAGIAVSIFKSTGGWNLNIRDLSGGAGVVRTFPPGMGDTLKVGDQEAFALESYSRSAATFKSMGNLTLQGLFLDGTKVSGGIYVYTDWDPSHNPLFAVGSSGASPPSFVSLARTDDGAFVWSYTTNWTSDEGYPTMAWVTELVVVAAILTIGGVALWEITRSRHRADIPNV